MQRIRVFLVIVGAAVTVAVLHGSAAADPIKCTRTIAKESAKARATAVKIINKCKNGVITKGTPASLANCPDAAGAQKITDTNSKMKAKIAGACGGADKTCGSGGDDDPLAAIHWNIGTCMGLEGQCTGIAINDCGDIADCLSCIGGVQTEQAVDTTVYDTFESAEFFPNNGAEPAKTVNKCQVAIAKNAVKFISAKEKVLDKCWDAKLSGKAGFNDNVKCPDTDPNPGSGNPPASPGDNKTVEAIKKLEQKKVAAICKACGASGDIDRNGMCDTASTLDINDIVGTVPYNCMNVSVPADAVHPSGENCGAITVTDLQSYVDCIDCVLEFKADCGTAAGVGDNAPSLGIAYPSECNAGGAGSCPTTYTFTANGPATDLDYGWGGFAHDQHLPTNARLKATVSACQNPTVPCGQCTLGGPISNGAGNVLNNQRCRGDSRIQCTSNAQCPGTGNACTYFFGPPQPIATGGVGFCLTSEMSGAIAGTVDTGTGAATLTMPTTMTDYLGVTQDDPCPRCIGGMCSGGQNSGQSCTINGSSALFGDDVSYDCPPSNSGIIGRVTTAIPLTTGTQTATLTVSNPNCTAVGFTSLKCMCDTCDNAAATPCMTDADCAAVGATVCGGKRCIGGANVGMPCTVNGDCSSNVCTRAGEPTKPNACSGGVCLSNPGDTDSTDEGQCQTGPNDNRCSAQTYRSCATANDCRPPSEGGSCSSCTPGMQTCVTQPRECYTANGALGDDVSAGGVASPTTPTLAGLFCGAATTSAAVNAVWGLPGLFRYTLPGTSTIQ